MPNASQNSNLLTFDLQPLTPFSAGYVQGMSDLLAPLLAVLDNEVDTFWCFAGYMDMVVSV